MAKRDGTKTGGRKKGTPNKETIDAKAIADRLGIDPFEVLLHLAGGNWSELGYKAPDRLVSATKFGDIYEDHITASIRAKAAGDACKYLYPQRKAIEFKDEDGNNLPLVMVSLPSNGRERKD